MIDEHKVWIRGVEGRGSEVIKMLEDYGGSKHCQLDGEDPNYIYFITHKGNIFMEYAYTEMGKIIMDNYREIKLPENWKDGDILFSETDNEFAVFKGGYKINSVNADKFFCHIATCFKGYLTYQAICRKDFRLATKSEVAQFHERLHAINKDWDAEKKQLVDWKWKPKNGEKYWRINTVGDVDSKSWRFDLVDELCIDFGNCFRTQKEAEVMAEKIKKLLKGGEE